MTPYTLILDFDSTFIKCETLDTLVKIIYHDSNELPAILHRIESETKASMAGTLSIHDSLVSRVKALKIRKDHIIQVIEFLKTQISDSIFKNADFIEENAENIFIFSGGFKEIIIPVVKDFGIPPTQVFANEFTYDHDAVTGIDSECLMAHNFGKAKQLALLKRTGQVDVLGDGATDAEIKTQSDSVKFYLFAENILRENLVDKADKVIYSFDEYLANTLAQVDTTIAD